MWDYMWDYIYFFITLASGGVDLIPIKIAYMTEAWALVAAKKIHICFDFIYYVNNVIM